MGVDVQVLLKAEPSSSSSSSSSSNNVTSKKPKKGQTCVMHYEGKLENDFVFDSSYKKNRPFKFVLGQGQVIRGWDEGVLQMAKGEKARLTITSDYAYGSRGVPDVIPPNATLIFDVHLEDFY